MGYQMPVSEAITTAYQAATGKGVPPVAGTSKYTKLLAYLNTYQRIWALEDGQSWKSLRNVFTIGTVTATDTFSLDTDINKLSDQEGDFVRIYHTDGVVESDYTIVDIERLYDDNRTINNGGIGTFNAQGTCAVSGANLIFSTPFTATDPQFGGTIKAPGYSIPDTLVNAGDIIQVDDPYWLCFRVAAEYVLTDVTRVQLRPSLLDQATDRMSSMKQNNGSQRTGSYRGGWRPLGNTTD